MDPNVALQRLRRAVSKVNQLRNQAPKPRYMADFSELEHQAVELAEVFEGLDKWLSVGGLRPSAWLKGEAE